ncbi:MAG: hypothetical protein AB8G96_11415 [Phycisphaerales bacterium]
MNRPRTISLFPPRRPDARRRPRSRRIHRIAAASVGAITLVVLGWAGVPAAGQARTNMTLSDRWGERLSRLDPAAAMGYLALAEEIEDRRVANSSAGRAELELVRRLYGLAGGLDERLRPGALRALADLTSQDGERRRMLAMAELLEGSRRLRGRPPRFSGAQARIRPLSPVDLGHFVETMAARRMGDDELAIEAFEAIDVDVAVSLLESWPGGSDGFRVRLASERTVATDTQLRRELSLEIAVLLGPSTGWTETLLGGSRQSLVEVDLDDASTLLGVDTTRPRWRDGSWVE